MLKFNLSQKRVPASSGEIVKSISIEPDSKVVKPGDDQRVTPASQGDGD